MCRVGPALPGWAAGRVQTQISVRLGGGTPASRILSEGRFIQMLSALGAVPGSRERPRLGRSRLLIDLGYAGAYSQMYLPYASGTSPAMGSRPVSSTGQALRRNDGGRAFGAPLRVALDAGQAGYGIGHELGGDCLDLHSGVSPVACLEALVVELAVGDVEVEADDGAPVVGFLADDVRECGGPTSLFPVASFVLMAYAFYYEG